LPSFAESTKVETKDGWAHLFTTEKQALLCIFLFPSTNNTK